MVTAAKTVKAYAIQEIKSGYIWPNFIEPLRRDCISKWCGGNLPDWKEWRQTHEVIQVLITPVLPKPRKLRKGKK